MLPSNNDSERLYPLEGLINLLEDCIFQPDTVFKKGEYAL